MANYIATTEQFTATADAIRAKTGSSENLEWDASTGYADDIAAIPTGTDTSDATASADDIISGKTAYVNGSKVTGNIATKTASNLSASGKTVTVPAGYYASQATKDVATGSATAPASISGSSATVSTGTNTLTLSKTVSVTPSVSAGYVASGTAGNSSVSLTAAVTTKAAATITPGTTNQTIAAGTYLTGAQTIAGDADLVAGNIKKDVTIFGVTGTFEGTGTPYAVIDAFVQPEFIGTISATNGSDTITATPNNGHYILYIPTPQTVPESWTITWLNSYITISETVVITTKNQFEKIDLLVVDTVLENNSWDTISKVSQCGLGGSFWSLGDAKTISIDMKNMHGPNSSNMTYKQVYFWDGQYEEGNKVMSVSLRIIDFNHVDGGISSNNIMWGIYYPNQTSPSHIFDTMYGSTSSISTYPWLNMNHTTGQYNYGGWKGCDLRYDILGATSTPPSQYRTTKNANNVGYDATQSTITNPVPNSLMAALPSDFRSALRLRTHYVDNVGGASNVAANVTAVTDAISILAEYETGFGRRRANQFEQDKQTVMGLYRLNGGFYVVNGGKNSGFTSDTSDNYTWYCSANYYVSTSFAANTSKANSDNLHQINVTSNKVIGIYPIFMT